MIVTNEAEKTVGALSQRCINASFMSLDKYIDDYKPTLNCQHFNTIEYSGCLTSGMTFQCCPASIEQDIFGTPGDGCLYCIGHIDMNGLVTIGDLSKVHSSTDCSYSWSTVTSSFTFPYYNDCCSGARCSYTCWCTYSVPSARYCYYCDNCVIAYDIECNEVYDPRCLVVCCLSSGCHSCSDRCSVQRTITATLVCEAWNNGTIAICCQAKLLVDFPPAPNAYPKGSKFCIIRSCAYVTDSCGIFMTRQRASECKMVVACTLCYCCQCCLGNYCGCDCCYPIAKSANDCVIAYWPLVMECEACHGSLDINPYGWFDVDDICVCRNCRCFNMPTCCGLTVFNAEEVDCNLVLTLNGQSVDCGCSRNICCFGFVYPWSFDCAQCASSYRSGVVTCAVIANYNNPKYHSLVHADCWCNWVSTYCCCEAKNCGYANWNPNDAYFSYLGNANTIKNACWLGYLVTRCLAYGPLYRWCNECGIDYYVTCVNCFAENNWKRAIPSNCRIENCLTSVALNCEHYSKMRYAGSEASSTCSYVSYVQDVAYQKRETTIYCVFEHWNNDADLSGCNWCIYMEYV